MEHDKTHRQSSNGHHEMAQQNGGIAGSDHQHSIADRRHIQQSDVRTHQRSRYRPRHRQRQKQRNHQHNHQHLLLTKHGKTRVGPTMPASRPTFAATVAAISERGDSMEYDELLKCVAELDNGFADLLGKRSPTDKQAVAIRKAIVKAYETMLFKDFDTSCQKDVIHRMWKGAFYRPIGEFRKMIKKYQAAVSAASKTEHVGLVAPSAITILSTRAHPGNDNHEKPTMTTSANSDRAKLETEDAAEEDTTNKKTPQSGPQSKLEKSSAAFHKFLSEATDYFRGLIGRCEAWLQAIGNDAERIAKQRAMDRFVTHRIYIILGDLERYSQLYSQGDSPKVWNLARDYYCRSLAVYPFNGNAHNQLAVLATYSQKMSGSQPSDVFALDEVEAIYRYFRSLAVPERPFSSARENLILLFEENRQRFLQLQLQQQLHQTAIGRGRSSRRNRRTRRRGGMRGGAGAQQRDDVEDDVEVNLYTALTQFVRMHGILFTRTSLETMEDIMKQTFRELKKLHSDHDMEDIISETLVLKLVAMNIFCIERSLDNEGFLEMAVALACRFLQFVAMSCLDGWITEDYGHLCAVHLMLRYIRLKQEKLTEQSPASTLLTFRDGTMWKCVASLLNNIVETRSNITDSESDKENDAMECLPEDIEFTGFKPLMSGVPENVDNSDENCPTAATYDQLQQIRMSRIKREADILTSMETCLLEVDESGIYVVAQCSEDVNDGSPQSTPVTKRSKAKERRRKRRTERRKNARIVAPVPVFASSTAPEERDMLDDIRSEASDDDDDDSDGSLQSPATEQWPISLHVKDYSLSPSSFSGEASISPPEARQGEKLQDVSDQRAIGHEPFGNVQPTDILDQAVAFGQRLSTGSTATEEGRLSTLHHQLHHHHEQQSLQPEKRSIDPSMDVMQQLLGGIPSSHHQHQFQTQPQWQPYSLFSSSPSAPEGPSMQQVPLPERVVGQPPHPVLPMAQQGNAIWSNNGFGSVSSLTSKTIERPQQDNSTSAATSNLQRVATGSSWGTVGASRDLWRTYPWGSAPHHHQQQHDGSSYSMQMPQREAPQLGRFHQQTEPSTYQQQQHDGLTSWRPFGSSQTSPVGTQQQQSGRSLQYSSFHHFQRQGHLLQEQRSRQDGDT